MTAAVCDVLDPATAATMADLLAHWWSRPIAGEIDSWSGWHELGRNVAEATGTATPMEHLLSPIPAEERRALIDEHERLFVGPGTVPCPPYESVWRNDVPVHLRRSLMGPCTEDLRRLYTEIGLQVAPSSGELPDHVAVELEALAYAIRSPGSIQSAGALLTDHLAKWLPAFCRAVAHETAQPFYKELAVLTPGWLAELARQLPGSDR